MSIPGEDESTDQESRCAACGTPARTGFTYSAASEVPGAVLSPERDREMRQRLREWDEAQRLVPRWVTRIDEDRIVAALGQKRLAYRSIAEAVEVLAALDVHRERKP